MELLILCLKIFFVRILDVSLGTFRTINVVKGRSLFASVVGFIEVLIWFLIVKEALNTDVDSIWVAISYSAGFATGTFIGGKLSERFISGVLTVQVICEQNDDIVNEIRKHGYGVSVMDVRGQEKERYMLISEINKKQLHDYIELVKSLDPKSFITVDETKMVQNGFIK